MSIEVVLIPLAIALTKEIVEGISKQLQHGGQRYTILPTRMKDEALLEQALNDWSCSLRKAESADSITFGGEREATFIVNEEGGYDLILPESADREAFAEWVEKVELSYQHYLQQSVYSSLIEKAKEQGLILETEEVLEDNSIQVTYILNG